MDVKKEGVMDGMMDGMMGGMAGGMVGGMMGGMMDGMMGGHTPQHIIKMLAESEKMEAALYVRIARGVPSEELRRIIMHRAKHELREAERISMLSHHFGMMPHDPPGAPMPYASEDNK